MAAGPLGLERLSATAPAALKGDAVNNHCTGERGALAPLFQSALQGANAPRSPF
jgi:hypothetical protein